MTMALDGHRFKIDFYDSDYSPFALYRRERHMFFDKWHVIDRRATRDKCREFYEKVKDLPEYLD